MMGGKLHDRRLQLSLAHRDRACGVKRHGGCLKAVCPPQVPVWLLKATRGFLRSFQWARDAADRLVQLPPSFCWPLMRCVALHARTSSAAPTK